MKQGEILNAYRVLGESKMSTLEVGEVVKVVKARKAMRPIAEGLDAFMKDIEKSLGATSPELDYCLETLNNFLVQ